MLMVPILILSIADILIRHAPLNVKQFHMYFLYIF